MRTVCSRLLIVLEMFLGRFHIDDFSYVDDRGNLNESILGSIQGESRLVAAAGMAAGYLNLQSLNDEELCRVNE